MVLRPLDKSVLKRLRSVVKREQVKSGRRFPKRVLRAFGRLKNIDERTLLVRSLGIPQRNSKRIDAWEDKMLRGPGQGVRLLKLKSGEVVMKFPTLAARHYKVTPSEEIKFVRRLTGMVNTNLAGNGFAIEGNCRNVQFLLTHRLVHVYPPYYRHHPAEIAPECPAGGR